MARYRRYRVDGWAVVGVVVTALLALAFWLGLCEAAFGSEPPGHVPLAASVLTDARTMDGRLEWSAKDGLVTTGPVVSWNKEQPEHLWGGGFFGLLTVTPGGAMPLKNLFPWVGDWLGLPETIGVTVRLGGQIEVVNVAHGPDLVGAPFLEVEVGPLLFDFRVQIAEGGAIEDLMESRPTFFLGLRPIRF
jgi:hypothetical protein